MVTVKPLYELGFFFKTEFCTDVIILWKFIIVYEPVSKGLVKTVCGNSSSENNDQQKARRRFLIVLPPPNNI